jgi:hypothetical protein
VKERPILFSGEMVRALLAGTKTQTRLVMKPQPVEGVKWDSRMGCAIHLDHWQNPIGTHTCPYGVPGDRLWVRETWMQLYDAGDGVLTCLQPSGVGCQVALRRAKYRATDRPPENFAGRWRSAMHMPRWASRITLEITDVRVQRLQEISEEDARAEGIVACENGTFDGGGPAMGPTARQAFMRLWDSINLKRAPWASNPFVWVVSIRRL